VRTVRDLGSGVRLSDLANGTEFGLDRIRSIRVLARAIMKTSSLRDSDRCCGKSADAHAVEARQGDIYQVVATSIGADGGWMKENDKVCRSENYKKILTSCSHACAVIVSWESESLANHVRTGRVGNVLNS
jgi:hypothetical protein